MDADKKEIDEIIKNHNHWEIIKKNVVSLHTDYGKNAFII
jgi:hypothetical protein